MSNLPRTPIDRVAIGLKVRAYFVALGQVYLPEFEDR